MKALPTSFAIVSGQPHTSGAYGEGDGATTGVENGHVGRTIHSAQIVAPAAIPVGMEMNEDARTPSPQLCDGRAKRRHTMRQTRPAASVAADLAA